MSFAKIGLEFAARGFVNGKGNPFSASAVQSMVDA